MYKDTLDEALYEEAIEIYETLRNYVLSHGLSLLDSEEAVSGLYVLLS